MQAAVPLTVFFRQPGFFLTDTRLIVSLDGGVLYDGSFQSGFERTVEVWLGAHQLVTMIPVGPMQRTKQYVLTIGAARGYSAELRYSRFWGNFTAAVRLVAY